MAKKLYFNTTRARKVKLDVVNVKKIYINTDCGFSSGHVWQKWNSVLTYAEVHTPCAGQTVWSGNFSNCHLNAGTSGEYIFNTTNGIYTVPDCQQGPSMLPSYSNWNTDGYAIGYPTSNGSQKNFSQIAKLSFTRYNTDNVICSGSVGTKYTSTSTYIKGSTSYGNVEADDINAYPSNGRHTDGYWYVLVE